MGLTMKSRKVRILLADDHHVLRTGLRALLQARKGWQVCAEATNGIEAVRLAAEHKPDIIVLDLEMGGLDGLTVVREIKKHHQQIEVVVFTMHDDEYLVSAVLAAGARAFVLKSEKERTLIDAIESAADHKVFVSGRGPRIQRVAARTSGHADSEPSPLTRRETEVVRLLAIGRSNKEVAHTLGISVKTVETHRAAIMRKLGFRSIVSLVRYAVRERFVQA
jgi:DNA-binding NarL/FixJ family response regulator